MQLAQLQILKHMIVTPQIFEHLIDYPLHSVVISRFNCQLINLSMTRHPNTWCLLESHRGMKHASLLENIKSQVNKYLVLGFRSILLEYHNRKIWLSVFVVAVIIIIIIIIKIFSNWTMKIKNQYRVLGFTTLRRDHCVSWHFWHKQHSRYNKYSFQWFIPLKYPISIIVVFLLYKIIDFDNNRLRPFQPSAARVLTNTWKYDHSSSHLRVHGWLPVREAYSRFTTNWWIRQRRSVLCQKGVSSFTPPPYLWRSLGPFSLPCAQTWP